MHLHDKNTVNLPDYGWLFIRAFILALLPVLAFPSIALGDAVESVNDGCAIATQSSAIDINNCEITVRKSAAYKAAPIRLSPKITYKNKQLKKGTDYEVSYKNNTSIGTATVVITGKGLFSGTTTRRFAIRYSNTALAVAACRLSYSRVKNGKQVASVSNGYRGTVMYRRYSRNKKRFSCDEIVQIAVRYYMKADKSYPNGVQEQLEYLNKSKQWKCIGVYHEGMKLQPGDVYNRGHHTCMYVGTRIARWTYAKYLKESSATKMRLRKRSADFGSPTTGSAWVASHSSYFGGSAAHICGTKDALVNLWAKGYIYRYIGKGHGDPNDVTS